jgi:hypothetical protein
MRNIIFAALLAVSSAFYAQDTLKIQECSKLNNSQKYGLTTSKNTVELRLLITETTISFASSPKQKMSVYTAKKKTDKYIIGESNGNYLFYDIKGNQLHVIDYFMSRYSVYSYGKPYSAVKQTSTQMMENLKGGQSQREVIQHLVEQTSYDF